VYDIHRVGWDGVNDGVFEDEEAGAAGGGGDRSLLLQSAAEAEAEGDFPCARRAFRIILDRRNALADDYNMYAWLSLFDEQVATRLSKPRSKPTRPRTITTLTCTRSHATMPRAAKPRRRANFCCRQCLQTTWKSQAAQSGMGSVVSTIQYGVYGAAAAAYQRVERPDGVIHPTDTFVLAQSRLKALHRN
jgi:hypothetical protein